MNANLKMFSRAVALMLTVVIPGTNAAVTLDRTRAIYQSDAASISLNIVNENGELPFLAQSWLENEQHKKISTPLVVIPPLQRLEAKERGVVRITKTPQVALLAQDRESVFYFNLREIPPKSAKSNIMQLAIQTQIKLFYRPLSIVAPKGRVWQEKLVFFKKGDTLTIQNPTPFYVTLVSMTRQTQKQGGGNIAGFRSIMLKPKSSESVKLLETNINRFVITYINDFGGQPELPFICKGTICTAVVEKK